MAACLPTCLPTYLHTHIHMYRDVDYARSRVRAPFRGASRRVLNAAATCSAHAHTCSETCTCQIGATYIHIYTIYICVYSRIVQVSRFHLCARRELKTSPSCNVTETVTKYLQPPSPLAAPSRRYRCRQCSLTKLNETCVCNSQILCGKSFAKKGKGKLTAVNCS